MIKLILSIIASSVLLIFTVVLVILKQPKKNGTELVIVSEIPETSVMGAILIIIGYILLILKMRDPALAGTDETSYNFVSVLALMCVVSGCWTMLITFVKKVIAYPERFTAITSVGLQSEYLWKSVTEVKTNPMSLRSNFKVGGDSVSINGRAAEYGKFIGIAKEKVPAVVGSDVLGNLYKRVTRQGFFKQIH